MDVAINSSDFCHAARRAMRVIVEQAATIAILNGATWIFFIAGLGTITAAGAYITFIAVKGLPYFSDAEKYPATYVAEPVPVTVAAGIISAIIAWSFLIVFDTVSDTVLYCFAIEKKRRGMRPPQIDTNYEYAPATLNALINDDK